MNPKPCWYRIRAARTSAEIRIYEEIGLWGITAKNFANDLEALGDLKQLTVRLHSPGGDVYDAMAIHNALQRHPAAVTVYIDGLCASAATLVALAGDEVHMASNGQYMIHEPWTFTVGDAEDHQRRADLLDTTADQIVALYARKSGQSPDSIRDLMRAETWMTAQQALDLGFIDAIDEPLRIAAKVFDLSRFANPPKGPSMSDTPEDTLPVAAPVVAPDSLPTAASPAEPPTPVVEAALSPSAIARACLAAKEPDLIPVVLASPITAEALAERLKQAGEIRALCAMVHQSSRAAGFIASGATPTDVKAGLWEALVVTDRAAGELDTHPPQSATDLRATFEADAGLRAEFGDFETYSAFMGAALNGRATILRSKAL